MPSIRQRRSGNSYLFREQLPDGTVRQRSIFLGPHTSLTDAAGHWRSEIDRLQAKHTATPLWRGFTRERILAEISTAQDRLADIEGLLRHQEGQS